MTREDQQELEIANRHAEWMENAERVFEWAGFRYCTYKEIPNEYCGPVGCSICASHPWLLVSTPDQGLGTPAQGTFKFGWRKRVLVLDWSQTTFVPTAEELFKDQSVTKGGRMIHCYGYGAAVEYLRRLQGRGY